MAIPDNMQTLSAAFSFGTLLQAATGASLLYFKGHGSTILKDGRRLVLVLFLLFSALWAQIDFLDLLIPTTRKGLCQVGLILSTAFDQLARIAIEQFLLWSIGHGTKMTAVRAILQGILVIRLVAGGVMVGFTRPEFAPSCVAHTSLFPTAIVVPVLDIVIVGFLLVQASSLGMFGDRRENHRVQSKALLFIIAGLTIWTALSVPMFLGMASIILILKTVLPANGLLVLIGVITIYPNALMLQKGEDPLTADARSPFSSPLPQSRNIIGGRVRADGDAIVEEVYPKYGAADPGKPTVMSVTRPIRASDAGFQASNNVFPSVFAASSQALFTGTQTSRSGLDTPTSAKRSVFTQSKAQPKSSIRGLAISNPIMNPDADSAEQPFARIATIDLETAALNDRERRAIASKKSPFSAPRAVPLPPSMSPEDLMKKDAGLGRKRLQSQTRDNLPVTALSTSTSLSPGHEEVRRRSPRTEHRADNTSERNIRPMTGLPSNPRARGNHAPFKPSIPAPQTVMLMNNIVYDDPAMVQSIIKESPAQYDSIYLMPDETQTISYTTELKSSGPVIHRPRPIPRSMSNGMFAGETANGHRRTKSGSSITSRKSFFASNPGSPTKLPPLPKPPPVYSAANLKRLLPNDTKSMTFDEKIQLLFPAPPGISLINKRRSSVPSLPRVPSVFLTETPARSPTEINQQEKRSSKRSTIALFKSQDEPIKSSSKYDRRKHDTLSSSATLVQSHASVDTSILHIGIEQSLQVSSERSGVQKPFASKNHESHADPSEASGVSFRNEIVENQPVLQEEEEFGEGDELMIVMMDSAEHRRSMLETTSDSRESFVPGATILAESAVPPRSWHRRIGDELPSFSDRKSKHVSRRLSPPTPLLLDSRQGGRQTMIILTAEPSPPLDSPTKALEEIQVQLSRLEVPNRESLGAMLRKMPDTTQDIGSLRADNDMERLKLLENLEREMGEQESDWQKLQQNFSRDSLSSIGTPRSQLPPGESGSDISRRSSARTSQISSRDISQRIKAGDNFVGIPNTDTTGTTEPIPKNLHLSVWQQRLAKAQMSYEQNAPELSRRPNLNFLSLKPARKPQLGSPTPPESEDEEEFEAPILEDLVFPTTQVPSLWQHCPKSQNVMAGKLWQPTIATKSDPQSPEIPAKDLRPKQRSSINDLRISTFSLWSNPKESSKNTTVKGLWGSSLSRSSSIKARPVTQRPPRRPRRMTLLADIVENPEPLPNKRDTLGLFQFPWGERSDTAVPQYTVNTSWPAGPVVNAIPRAGSKQVGYGYDEYSSSFFDDYDDEDELDNEIMDSESDDEFDETTLWEIATLLQSTNIPSMDSLLPPLVVPEETVDNYEEEDGSISYYDSEEEDLDINGEPVVEATSTSYSEVDNYDDSERYNFEEARESIVIFSQEHGIYRDEADIADESSDMATMITKSTFCADSIDFEDKKLNYPGTESFLWKSSKDLADNKSYFGLPQPENQTWQSYKLSSFDNVRARTRSQTTLSDSQSRLLTNELWSVRNLPVKAEMTWLTHSKIKSSPAAAAPTTWTPNQVLEEELREGLFSLQTKRQNFRSTIKLPAAIDMRRPPRKVLSDLPKLASQALWCMEASSVPKDNGCMWAPQTKIGSPVDEFPHDPTLWVPTTITPVASAQSLYASWAPWSAYRRSELEPAALNMRVKPRIVNSNHAVLESCKLWSPLEVCPSNESHDWISESSIRPASPSIYSISSSGRSSPDIFEALSITSTSTKASSFQPTSVNPAQRLPSAKKLEENIPPPRLPAGPTKYMLAAPTRLLASKPSMDVRESKIPTSSPQEELRVPTLPSSTRQPRVLASRSIFEVNASSSQESVSRKFRRPVSPVKTAKAYHRAIRHQYRPTMAFRANWDDALREAMLAGSSKPDGTAENWDLALAEAVVAGGGIVVETEHGTESKILRPAGTAGAMRYDASVLHPVFFTTNMISVTPNVHPACIGHVKLAVFQPSNQARLWSQKSTSVENHTISGLWPATSSPSSYFVTISGYQSSSTSRKSRKSASRLPALTSFELWQFVPAHSVSRDWLYSSSQSPNGIFPLFRKQAPPLTSNLRKSMMWAAGSPTLADIPDLFAGINSVLGPAKRFSNVRNFGLEKLESRTLFGVSSEEKKRTPVNWLNITSAPSTVEEVIDEQSTTKIVSEYQSTEMTKIQSPAAIKDDLSEEKTHKQSERFMAKPKPTSHLWTPHPRNDVIENTGTWTNVRQPSASIPDMFSKELKAHSSRRSHVSRGELEKLESIELFVPISRHETCVNWLTISHQFSHSSQPKDTAIRLDEVTLAPESLPSVEQSSFVHCPQLWTPPSAHALRADDDGLWSLTISPQNSAYSVIYDMHAAPIIRKRREDTQSKEIASTELWSKKHKQETPKHWLLV
ncbi:hypothetical protein ACMFMG_002825 [Clarireedia jacksonii]